MKPRLTDQPDGSGDRVDSSLARRARPKSPMRTCVGCRRRVAQVDLLRVVAVVFENRWIAIPDQQQRLPGRGAYLHPRHQCLHQAESRRAFNRAFRLGDAIDLQQLRTEVGAAGRD